MNTHRHLHYTQTLSANGQSVQHFHRIALTFRSFNRPLFRFRFASCDEYFIYYRTTIHSYVIRTRVEKPCTRKIGAIWFRWFVGLPFAFICVRFVNNHITFTFPIDVTSSAIWKDTNQRWKVSEWMRRGKWNLWANEWGKIVEISLAASARDPYKKKRNVLDV